MLQVKRIYEPVEATDGYRILVDRLWPRGLSKEKAAVDEWLKDIAPSAELRTWFGHKPERFAAFQSRYRAELAKNPAVHLLKERLQTYSTVTLLYGAHDTVHNQAVALRDYILG